jgi:hypothetical protein
MRRLNAVLVSVILFVAAFSSFAGSGRVLKVLPHLLDLKGRHALSPSLFDRDAYQAQLRQHPEQRSAVRFDILWRARGVTNSTLKLRAELRGSAQGQLAHEKTLETEVAVRHSSMGKWSALKLEGQAYKDFGDVTAWRVTLWDGEQLLGEEKSFLW